MVIKELMWVGLHKDVCVYCLPNGKFTIFLRRKSGSPLRILRNKNRDFTLDYLINEGFNYVSLPE